MDLDNQQFRIDFEYYFYVVVNRFRCPKEWQRFGGSCYYLSNVTSTAYEANQTCKLTYFNQSQLMKIRHPVELLYATDILVKHDLDELLVQIDLHLLQSKIYHITSSFLLYI